MKTRKPRSSVSNRTTPATSDHSPAAASQSPVPDPRSPILHDVQKSRDTRRVPINKVGVKDISYPIVVMDKLKKVQHTVARVNMYVDLPHQFKGTHMSRFVEILNSYREQIALDKMETMLEEMKQKLGASSAHLEIEFPYFIEKRAPVSGARSLMEYTCAFRASLNDTFDFVLEVRVPLTSLCPCSKELSRYGAHNQRSVMTVQVRYREFIWIEDLVTLMESCGSSPVYSLLKRQDEKFVTEQAFENPRFVEDMVREATLRLTADENISWFSVEAENFESIHNHSAYAAVERDKR
ncbi:GTP cyclohydrolase FolE2 [Geomobilimonas luticola]|uniref:GTP cyclohydrolase FolE2 n=1 Tax=Geomobilimonas luticola TaxID=1114878 RepID=A0ABS5SBA8_9BACT|nr:GTP cyclohydrolase FolE2 [Geomobilimonas luticola]MBT0652658.1 GTP cyclohydrolase I FolE2 [Geomobilimonas luticola]